MSVRLTVIGLNRIGVSIGLALKNNPSNITRIGSDANVGNEQKALKMDAFDKVVHNIPAAVEEAEMIILCVPMDEVRKNLEIIAPVLKPGAVVLDTSPLAAPVANWAEGILAKERYLISFHASRHPGHIVSLEDGIAQASADLFKNSMIAISAPSYTHPDAIKLAGDLAAILGGDEHIVERQAGNGVNIADAGIASVRDEQAAVRTDRDTCRVTQACLGGRPAVEGQFESSARLRPAEPRGYTVAPLFGDAERHVGGTGRNRHRHAHVGYLGTPYGDDGGPWLCASSTTRAGSAGPRRSAAYVAALLVSIRITGNSR